MFDKKTIAEKTKELREKNDQLMLENEMLRDRATTMKRDLNKQLEKELKK